MPSFTGPLSLPHALLVARWHDELAPHLYKWLVAQGPIQAEEAEDIIQDTFVRLMPHVAHLATLEPLFRRRYVFQIASNLSRDLLRRNSIHPVTRLDAYADPGDVSLIGAESASAEWLAHAQPYANPEQVTDARMSLRAAWDALPERYQRVLSLMMQGKDREQIAAAMGITPLATRALIWRMKRLLLELGSKVA